MTADRPLRILSLGAGVQSDDHLSDEAIAGGRVRVVLRSATELAAIARALELEADR